MLFNKVYFTNIECSVSPCNVINDVEPIDSTFHNL